MPRRMAIDKAGVLHAMTMIKVMRALLSFGTSDLQGKSRQQQGQRQRTEEIGCHILLTSLIIAYQISTFTRVSNQIEAS